MRKRRRDDAAREYLQRLLAIDTKHKPGLAALREIGCS